MVITNDQTGTTESTEDIDEPRPVDVALREPSARTPVGDEKEFAELVEGMVADFAPKMFAVVVEYGDRVDGAVVAWGMAFDDHAQLVNTSGKLHVSSRSPEDALRLFNRGQHFRPRLVWVNPDAATGDEE